MSKHSELADFGRGISREDTERYGVVKTIGALILLSLFACAQAQVMPLHLKDAMAMAIQNNVSVLLAEEKRREAEGQTIEARAPLMPSLSVKASQANSTQNLAAFGFPPSLFSIPPLIGPYDTFDARVQLVQNLFNLAASQTYRSKKIEAQIAGLRETLAQEQIAQMTAGAYLNGVTAERNVEAVKANLELAKALLKLAEDQRQAGIATGIDVARASTRVSEEETKRSTAQSNFVETSLALKRLIGVPLSTPIAFSDKIQVNPERFPSVDDAVREAENDRTEYQIAAAMIESEKARRASAEGERMPTFEFSTNYGESGNTPGQLSLPVRAFMLEMDLPIFNGGLTTGRIMETRSREAQAVITYQDTKKQIEEDVRLALETLDARADALRSAEKSLELAKTEVKLSEDRFKNGITDNLEVVNAETSLEDSRSAEISALADYTIARINLAAALGHARSFEW